MKQTHLLLLVAFSLLLSSCGRNDEYIIEGTLYGGRNFEDQTIYLVPFAGATADNIDSATIHDSRFYFDGTVKEDGIYILRMRPMMRLFIDELIIIKEPGHIRTKLSRTSSAKGTPQNDSLQKWREYKQCVDSLTVDIKKQMKKASDRETMALQQRLDSVKAQFDKHNRLSIQKNNNAFGEFLDKYVH